MPQELSRSSFPLTDTSSGLSMSEASEVNGENGCTASRTVLRFVLVSFLDSTYSPKKSWSQSLPALFNLTLPQVIFCVAMNEYDKMLYEEANVNRMHEAVSLFQQTVNSKWFESVHLILFLNKADLFRDKIKSVDLKVAFPDYTGGPTSPPFGY